MSGTARFVEFLRDAPWLAEERIVGYSRVALCIYAAATVIVVVTAHGGVDFNGHPLGTDFVSFWSAGALALDGHAADAYVPALHAARESALFGGAAIPYYTWTYPPIFLLIASVLALLPYGVALAVWLTTSGVAYVLSVRRLLPHPHAALVLLALPATILNLGHGQNGFLSAALLAGGLGLLESRPLAAGFVFGALAYKPQLLVLVPLALVADRRWRALAGMIISLTAWYALTVALFGADTWIAARDAMLATAKDRVLEQGAVLPSKMVTVFAAVRILGGTIGLAWIAQWAVSIATAALMIVVWYGKENVRLKAALLVAAIPLATPFLLDYDLVVLSIPAALLLREGLAAGFLPWERLMLATVCMMPAVARPLAAMAPLPVAVTIEAGFVVAIARRLAMDPWRTGANPSQSVR